MAYFIPYNKLDGEYNMKFDESLLEFCMANKGKVLLRFYGWDKPTVSIGRNQKNSGVDENFCKENDIPIVKRPTGGKALFHDKELTYSFVCPVDFLKNADNVVASYKEISEALIIGLKKFGINVDISEYKKVSPLKGYCMSLSTGSDVVYKNKKIIGSAQFRAKNYILQQGSIPLSLDIDVLKKIFNEDKNLDTFTTLSEIVDKIDLDFLCNCIKEGFEEKFDFKFEDLDLITKDFVKENMPKRPLNSNKGTFGKVFNFCGSKYMPGAGYLTATAALRVGAGYSILCCPDEIVSHYGATTPNLVYLCYKVFGEETSESIVQQALTTNVLAIGPGLGVHQNVVTTVNHVLTRLSNYAMPVVIDADAINCLSVIKDFKLPPNSVLTPHPLELARLLEVSLDEIVQNRIKYAKMAAEKFNCIMVLKGYNSIIASPDGHIMVNTTGNSALAKAGSGDVLTGMIAGLISQNNNPFVSAVMAVYLHGLAGEIYANANSEYSMLASDLLDFIPKALKETLI